MLSIMFLFLSLTFTSSQSITNPSTDVTVIEKIDKVEPAIIYDVKIYIITARKTITSKPFTISIEQSIWDRIVDKKHSEEDFDKLKSAIDLSLGVVHLTDEKDIDCALQTFRGEECQCVEGFMRNQRRLGKIKEEN